MKNLADGPCHCGLPHGECDENCRCEPACEPAAGDPLGEMARQVVYIWKENGSGDAVADIRAAFERLVREIADECMRTGLRLYPEPAKSGAHDVGFGACADCKEAILARYGLTAGKEGERG